MRRRRAWASWNYHLLPEPSRLSTVTYHMNRLQALEADREFCVTLNRSEVIYPGKVLRTITYAHPVFTAAGARAQARHHEISGTNRTHYAGAYWGWGFHEDGMRSAVAIAREFGVKSWTVADPADLESAVNAAFAHDGPTLIDVIAQPLEESAVPVSRWMG